MNAAALLCSALPNAIPSGRLAPARAFRVALGFLSFPGRQLPFRRPQPTEHPLMRKLNVKLFLILVIGAVVTAGSVWGLHVFQYKRIAAALLWQARRAEEAGKIDLMARYLDALFGVRASRH